MPALAAVQQAVHAGAIGDPLLSFSQKTYRWGTKRPDFYRDRKTFPGLAPWIGIHAFDWLHWILGDVFTEVQGREGTTARPDFPACGSQAAFVLTMRNGGVATVTLDYLRPATAPTHADERLRIAGTRGVIETALIEHKVTLITESNPPQTLPVARQTDIFTQFARSLCGEGPPPLTLHEACRITEIAIKANRPPIRRLLYRWPNPFITRQTSARPRLAGIQCLTSSRRHRNFDCPTRFQSGNLQARTAHLIDQLGDVEEFSDDSLSRTKRHEPRRASGRIGRAGHAGPPHSLEARGGSGTTC